MFAVKDVKKKKMFFLKATNKLKRSQTKLGPKVSGYLVNNAFTLLVV